MLLYLFLLLYVNLFHMLLYLKYNYMFSDLHVPEGLFKDIFTNTSSYI